MTVAHPAPSRLSHLHVTDQRSIISAHRKSHFISAPRSSEHVTTYNIADITPPGAHAQFLHRPHPHRRAHRPPILHRHRPRLAAAPLPVQVAGQRAILHAQLQPLLLVRAGPTTSALALRTPARDSARQAHEPQGAPRDGQLLHRPGLEHAPVRAVRCRAADDLARCAGPGRDEDCAVGAQGGGARVYYWRCGVLEQSV